MNAPKKPYTPAVVSDYGDAQQITKTANSPNETSSDSSGGPYTS
jgi:hypothetical protein